MPLEVIHIFGVEVEVSMDAHSVVPFPTAILCAGDRLSTVSRDTFLVCGFFKQKEPEPCTLDFRWCYAYSFLLAAFGGPSLSSGFGWPLWMGLGFGSLGAPALFVQNILVFVVVIYVGPDFFQIKKNVDCHLNLGAPIFSP